MVSFQSSPILEIDIILKMMKEFYAIDNYPIDLEVSRKLFEEFISNKNLGQSWLIYSENEIVGYVILTYIFSIEYKGGLAFLDELFIKKDFRGKGIGQQTIKFIKTEAEKSNVKMMYLEVENHNEIAQNLYLTNNFLIHNRKIMKFKF